MTRPTPHPDLLYPSTPQHAEYHRAIAKMNQFERAKLRAMNRVANVQRGKARKGMASAPEAL